MKTIGCIRGTLGSTTYYIAKMTAGELIESVGIAKELPEWADMTVDEKMQREVDMRRIVEEIVPYIINDPDRFIGSIIIDICPSKDEDEIKFLHDFEPLQSIVPRLPKAYAIQLEDMGFLNLSGKECLIALDGQHRLLSLKIAIRGIMGVPAGTKNFPALERLVPHPELAKEEVSVIFVEHTDTMKIRKIFNKINKYAKQTSRSDNIITSDDDMFALIARKLIAPGQVLAPVSDIERVNVKNNTLSARSKNLTTLSTLYNISETLLKARGIKKDVLLPPPEKIDEAYNYVASFWKVLLQNVDAYSEYMLLTHQNKSIQSLRESNLLLKPVTQMALAHVAALADTKHLNWETIAKKLNRVNWSFDNSLWFNILVIGSANKRMITGKDSVRNAGMVISYMVMGDHMSAEEITSVENIIKNASNNSSAALPEKVV